MIQPYYQDATVTLYQGDALAVLRALPPASVQTCITSPPYWGLRDYGHANQLGLEPTPEQYVANLVAVFREVRRVLRDDGTLWLNLAASYFGSGKGGGGSYENDGMTTSAGVHCASGGMSPIRSRQPSRDPAYGDVQESVGMSWLNYTSRLKPKDMVPIPWMVAMALQADGWYLRSDIIWAKPNPMPESVTDRPTKSHEYLFLLAKAERYYYDAEAIAEPVTASTIERLSQPTLDEQEGSYRVPGKTNGAMKAVGTGATRNRRSVWEIATQPYSGAHFATFPVNLVKPCVLAGSPPGGTVLDPFAGSGTACYVAKELGRQAIGIDLNVAYLDLAAKRLRQEVLL
jgi:DNA modification methylase